MLLLGLGWGEPVFFHTGRLLSEEVDLLLLEGVDLVLDLVVLDVELVDLVLQLLDAVEDFLGCSGLPFDGGANAHDSDRHRGVVAHHLLVLLQPKSEDLDDLGVGGLVQLHLDLLQLGDSLLSGGWYSLLTRGRCLLGLPAIAASTAHVSGSPIGLSTFASPGH